MQSPAVAVCWLKPSHCAQLLHTILHRTDLIVFPLTLQTITTAPMMSIWGKGGIQSHKLSLCLQSIPGGLCIMCCAHWWCVVGSQLRCYATPQWPLLDLRPIKYGRSDIAKTVHATCTRYVVTLVIELNRGIIMSTWHTPIQTRTPD